MAKGNAGQKDEDDLKMMERIDKNIILHLSNGLESILVSPRQELNLLYLVHIFICAFCSRGASK